jgi:hypothetical protein
MDDVEALSTIVGLLKQLEPDAQRRVLQSVQTFLGIELKGPNQDAPGHSIPLDPFQNEAIGRFSADRSLTAKEFLRDKMPSSDVERVACLAYFLAHYRDAPHFKTIDVSTLNTEAAQPKFSNASVAVDNATKQGYLVSASKGSKQISAAGERYVELLPDRERAREALASYRRKPRQKNARKLPSDV